MIEFLKDNQTIILWVLAVIIIPGIYVWWQIRHGKKIAIDGGVYKKPIMEINAIFEYFRNDATVDVYVGVELKEEYKFTILHFPMYFNNRGTKSLENVNCTITFPSNSALPIEKLSSRNAETNEQNRNVRSFVKSDDIISVFYKVGEIHPEVGIPHHELLRLRKESIKNPEKFSITMHAKDQLPLTVTINLHIVETNQYEKLWEHAMNKQYAINRDIVGYITAIPESKVVKMEIGKYQECVIKNAHIPFKPKGQFKFIPDNDYNKTG